MNRLLKRQLDRLGLSPEVPPDAEAWRALLARVDTTYEESNRDRAQVERSVALASADMQALNTKLRQSEARYRTLFEGSGSPMWLWERETRRFVEINEAALLVYGYSRDEFLAMRVEELFPESDRPAAFERIAALRETRIIGERRHLRKGGEVLVVALTSQPLVVGGRELVFSVAQDLTRQKALQEQLQQAQKMEAIGRLAGGIAHDFNNILAAVLADAEWIATELGAAHPLGTVASELVTAAERGGALTKQLLAFSRSQPWEPRVLSLGAIVAEMERLLQRLIGEDVRLTCSTAGVPVLVEVDRSQLEQILLNLVVNARDAMPRGGSVIVSAGAAVLDAETNGVPPGDYAVLSVSDTGCGMDAATLARVFEPFFTTKEPGRGTGLGLSTVFGIVRQSGGHVTVRSRPDRGSTFQVYFPRAERPAHDRSQPRVSLPPQGGTVLVVEDDRDVRRVVCRTLQSAGYSVVERENAVRALDLVDDPSTPLRLVLTDVVMPGMTGLELQARLRSSRPDTPVLLMSGYNDQIAQLESAGALLRKPFTPKQLRRAVVDALSTRPASVALADHGERGL